MPNGPDAILCDVAHLARLQCLAHQVNDSCDCRCQFCQVWRRAPTPTRSLSLEEVRALHAEARGLGIGTYIVYGGEPLLRKDLPRLLESAKEHDLRVFLCSNSGRLLERVEELAPLVDLYLVSIDGDAATHDRVRGHGGLFEKALRGLEALIGRGPEVRIWSHLHRENAEQVDDIAALAARLGVRVDFFPTHSTGRYVNDLALGPEERRAAFGRVAELKREGLPIVTSDALLSLMAEGGAFRCTWPETTVYVAHDGEVRSCERVDGECLGNVREASLAEIVGSARFASAAAELATCNACALPCVMSMAEAV